MAVRPGRARPDLTYGEADALWRLAVSITADPDQFKAVMPHFRDRQAARRAVEKIEAALWPREDTGAA